MVTVRLAWAVLERNEGGHVEMEDDGVEGWMHLLCWWRE